MRLRSEAKLASSILRGDHGVNIFASNIAALYNNKMGLLKVKPNLTHWHYIMYASFEQFPIKWGFGNC